jgi:hypothetical protein
MCSVGVRSVLNTRIGVNSILLCVELLVSAVKKATAWVFLQRKARSVLRSLVQEEDMIALLLMRADEERPGSGRFEKLIWCTAKQSESPGWSSTMSGHNVRMDVYAT